MVSALRAIGVSFDTFDILTDEEVRQGLKEYSQWPTYPQLYVKGELLGGCDVILEMQQDGNPLFWSTTAYLRMSLHGSFRSLLSLHAEILHCHISNTGTLWLQL